MSNIVVEFKSKNTKSALFEKRWATSPYLFKGGSNWGHQNVLPGDTVGQVIDQLCRLRKWSEAKQIGRKVSGAR